MDDRGTLLQKAIEGNKQDFVRILLEYGFVCLAMATTMNICRNQFQFQSRVDPTANSEVQPRTPLEITLECHFHQSDNTGAVLHILAEFMEMPDHVKHIQLALFINSDDDDERSNEEFCKIMKSLPLELVKNFSQNILQLLAIIGNCW